MNLLMYTDGAARGNPGSAGIGVVIYNETGDVLREYCEYIGTATNNVAEYRALISGLKLAAGFAPCALEVRLDSELVVRQLQGVYRVKDATLAGYFQMVRGLLAPFLRTVFAHIPRTRNTVADGLANRAIDTRAQGSSEASSACGDLFEKQP